MGHLKQHMCSHTGLWPFKCGACGKGRYRKILTICHIHRVKIDNDWYLLLFGKF